MARLRDNLIAFELFLTLLVFGGGCLLSMVTAVAIGLLLKVLLGWDWLVATLMAWMAIKFVYMTLDLFDFNKKKSTGPPCPFCGEKLRTPKAQQCFHCGEKWHGQSLERGDDA